MYGLVKIIGICGGSGSGKTTLAHKLVEKLGYEEASILCMDDYYRPLSHQQKDDNGFVNFDLPSALNISKFIDDIKSLKNGEPISLRKYSFNAKVLPSNEEKILPKKYVITEGIFLLHDDQVRKLIDDVIFIDTKEEVMLERRLGRDMIERNIKKSIVLYQWNNHFIPAYHNYVLPHKKKANLILDGTQKTLVDSIIHYLKS